jgi:hypothetical protein
MKKSNKKVVPIKELTPEQKLINKLQVDLQNSRDAVKRWSDFASNLNQVLFNREAQAQRLHEERKLTAQKTHRRQEQLRFYQEKLELMKQWHGIFRTIGQKLGICR